VIHRAEVIWVACWTVIILLLLVGQALAKVLG
jgi:hypothetical protein